GVRLITCDTMFALAEAKGNWQIKVDIAVKAFAEDIYPVRLQNAPIRMGELYDPRDYPTVEEIGGRYSFSVTIMPMPRSVPCMPVRT
ncbi:hypothetical protein LCGC14_2606700, partial [marine sediment metagenome]